MHARFSARQSGREARAEVVVRDLEGTVLAEFRGIRLHRLEGGSSRARTPLERVQRSAQRIGDTVRMPMTALTRVVDRLPAGCRQAVVVRQPAQAAAAVGPFEAKAASPAPRAAEVARGPVGGAGDAGEAFLNAAAHVLGMPRDRLDLRRTLQAYGIDSVTAAQLRGRVRRETGRDIALLRLLGEDSLRSLATELAAARAVRD
ncbi:acyl carrier protein [Streptomyces sp. NPDC046161]|uniref:acyl carrier protein n=1 Tax=Streptomyces sp. NPDC046161 TaxID=3155132 RepID=UPI0033D9F548